MKTLIRSEIYLDAYAGASSLTGHDDGYVAGDLACVMIDQVMEFVRVVRFALLQRFACDLQLHIRERMIQQIDQGIDWPCPDQDQRGEPRPLDGDDDGHAVCDSGAYEYRFASGDPMTTIYWVPVAARQNGALDSRWRTSVAMLNPAGDTAQVELVFHGDTGILSSPSRSHQESS